MRYLYKKIKGIGHGKQVWSRSTPLKFKIMNGSYWILIKKVTEDQFSRMN